MNFMESALSSTGSLGILDYLDVARFGKMVGLPESNGQLYSSITSQPVILRIGEGLILVDLIPLAFESALVYLVAKKIVDSLK